MGRSVEYSSDESDLERYLIAMHSATKTPSSDISKLDDAFRACFTKVRMDGPSTPVIYLDDKLFRSFKEARAYASSDDKASFVRQATGGKRRRSKGDEGDAETPTPAQGSAGCSKPSRGGGGEDRSKRKVHEDEAYELQPDDDSVLAALAAARIRPANESFGAHVHAVACARRMRIPHVHFERLKGMIDHQLRLAVHIGTHLCDAGLASPFEASGTLRFDALEKLWRESKLMSAEYLWALLWALRFEGALDPTEHVDRDAAKRDARIARECVGKAAANTTFGAHVHAVYTNPQLAAPPSFAGEVSWMISSRLQHAMYIGRFLCNEGMACPFDAEGKLNKKALAELWRNEKRFGAEQLWAVLWGVQDDYAREDTRIEAEAKAEADEAAAKAKAKAADGGANAQPKAKGAAVVVDEEDEEAASEAEPQHDDSDSGDDDDDDERDDRGAKIGRGRERGSNRDEEDEVF